MKKKKSAYRYRSAITGRYVSEKYAKAYPERTVREKIKHLTTKK